MKIVTIVNMKGGVGKTTISVGLAYELAESFDKDVLLMDIDPQTNATLLVMKEEEYRTIDLACRTIADLYSGNTKGLMGEKKKISASDVIISNPWNVSPGRMDLIPSSIRLFEVKRMLAAIPYSEETLKKKLQSIHSLQHDFCIIDSPPDFDILVISALAASNFYIIPVRPDYMSQQGLIVLDNKFEQIKDHISCELLGYVISLIPPTRSSYHKSIVEELEDRFKDKILAKIKELQCYSMWASAHTPLKASKDRFPFVEIARRLIEEG